jgi:zinc transporter ZupT
MDEFLIIIIISIVSYFVLYILYCVADMIEKLIAAFILGAETIIFTMFPYYFSKISSKKLIKIVDCFSGGLFLGIAFFHILPEANESLAHFFKEK